MVDPPLHIFTGHVEPRQDVTHESIAIDGDADISFFRESPGWSTRYFSAPRMDPGKNPRDFIINEQALKSLLRKFGIFFEHSYWVPCGSMPLCGLALSCAITWASACA